MGLLPSASKKPINFFKCNKLSRQGATTVSRTRRLQDGPRQSVNRNPGERLEKERIPQEKVLAMLRSPGFHSYRIENDDASNAFHVFVTPHATEWIRVRESGKEMEQEEINDVSDKILRALRVPVVSGSRVDLAAGSTRKPTVKVKDLITDGWRDSYRYQVVSYGARSFIVEKRRGDSDIALRNQDGTIVHSGLTTQASIQRFIQEIGRRYGLWVAKLEAPE
jgi:hypothetical protein